MTKYEKFAEVIIAKISDEIEVKPDLAMEWFAFPERKLETLNRWRRIIADAVESELK